MSMYTADAPADRWADVLTPSQAKVTELAATGLTNRGIAAAIFVTEQTVKFHLTNAYQRTDTRNRTELSSWWHDRVAAPAPAAAAEDLVRAMAQLVPASWLFNLSAEHRATLDAIVGSAGGTR